MNNKSNFISWLTTNGNIDKDNIDIESELTDFCYNLESIDVNSYNFFTIENIDELEIFIKEYLNDINYKNVIVDYPFTSSIIDFYSQYIKETFGLEKKKSFVNKLSKSECLFYIDKETNTLKEFEGNTQGSYNISKVIFDYAVSNKIFIESSDEFYPRQQDKGPYVLNEKYTFILGEGIRWLIGDENFSNTPKFIISINKSNSKIQIYRYTYRKLKQRTNTTDYDWFLYLYNKNIYGFNLLFTFDNENHQLMLDIIFPS